MNEELDGGGLEENEEIDLPTPEQRALRRKILVVALIPVLILSSVGIWHTFFRPWTIDELEEKIVNQYDDPSFDPYLAGATITVEGTVADFYALSTTLGPLTFITLEGAEVVRLVDWREPSFDVGDIIRREIHFEWSDYNEEHGVYSAQLDYPGLRYALNSQLWGLSLSGMGGILLFQRDDHITDSTIVEVYLNRGVGFPLRFFNASLRKGVGDGPFDDSWDAQGLYEDNPEVDYLGSLEQSIGQNGTLTFVDANSNGLLDYWDFFQLNLTRPSTDSGIFTFFLLVNDGARNGPGVLNGACFVVLTKRGILQIFSIEDAESEIFTGGWIGLKSEESTPSGVSAELVISDLWGLMPEIQNCGCSLVYGDEVLDCSALEEGLVASSNGLTITYSDADQNGKLSKQDLFLVSGLANLTEYSFTLLRDEYRLFGIAWTTGLGPHSGNVPVIDWAEPLALDYPANSTFKIQIERMYAIPGVLLGDSFERMVVDLRRNGISLLSFENLTSDFNYSSAEVDLTFEDADSNGYLNTGDFFTCVSSGVAEFEIVLSYVNPGIGGIGDITQPLISWPVSWAAG